MTLDPSRYAPLPPFAATNGPRDAKVVLIGEAWGRNEDEWRTPFIGWSGYELSKMAAEAGLTQEPPLSIDQVRSGNDVNSLMLKSWWGRQGLLLTNVFAFRPMDNKINAICARKREVGGKAYRRSAIGKEGYIRPEYLAELDRLKAELMAFPRTCLVALGAKACWALLDSPKIGKLRGVATHASGLIPSMKVLPTYHPAAIMRHWPWRPISVADLRKVARRERWDERVVRPERSVIINPSLAEVRQWLARPTFRLGVDTETKIRQIEMIGLARSPQDAIVIPLFDTSKPDGSYWARSEELEIWHLLKGVLENPLIEKVFQNGLFDLQYFLRRSPVKVFGVADDTMLLHHSLFPELQKGLGFLGSLYTNEAGWKVWRGKAQEELKRDE